MFKSSNSRNRIANSVQHTDTDFKCINLIDTIEHLQFQIYHEMNIDFPVRTFD